MFEILWSLLRMLGLLVAALVAAIMLWIFVLSVDLHRKNEGRIEAALQAYYPGKELRVERRVARETEWSAQFDNEICFAVAVRGKSGPPEHRIAMVSSDLDQGVWGFGREYSTMSDCAAAFNHG